MNSFVILSGKGTSSRGLTLFVTAVLPKPPICAIKLGHGRSSTDVMRALLAWVRRTRDSTDAAPLNPVGRWSWPARAFLITHGKEKRKKKTNSFVFSCKEDIVRGLTRFVTAALPKPPICAVKLEHRTSRTDVVNVLVAALSCSVVFKVTDPPSRGAVVRGFGIYGPASGGVRNFPPRSVTPDFWLKEQLVRT